MSTATRPYPLTWRTVSLGCKCVAAGVLTLLSGLALLGVFLVLQLLSQREEYAAQELRERGIPDATVLAALLIAALGWMLVLAGLCLCALTPAESGARPFALAALACWLLSMLAGLQTSFLPTIGFKPVTPRVVVEQQNRMPGVTAVNEIAFGASTAFLALTATLLSTALLGAIAAHFHNAGLIERVHRFLLVQIAVTGILAVIGFAYLYASASWRGASLWLSAPFLVGAFIDLAHGSWQLVRLLRAMREMLTIAEENARSDSDSST